MKSVLTICRAHFFTMSSLFSPLSSLSFISISPRSSFLSRNIRSSFRAMVKLLGIALLLPLVISFSPSTIFNKGLTRSAFSTTTVSTTNYSPVTSPSIRRGATELNAKNKKVVVLGGDGFCGWPTSLYLSDQGHGELLWQGCATGL